MRPTLLACAFVLATGIAVPAMADHVKLAALPAGTAAGNPSYMYLNRTGMLAGDRQWYRTFGWEASAGLMSLDPVGAGVPNLAGRWTEAINDQGQVLGTGCIPPAGGNGTCGTYLYRSQMGPGGAVTSRLDFSVLGGALALPGYMRDLRFSARGSVAGVFVVTSTSAAHPVVYTDASGWHDLTGLFPVGYAVQVIAMNAQDHVLLEVGNQMYMWTEAGGSVYVPGQPTMAVGVAMNDFDEIAGWTANASGNVAFRLSPTRGYQIVAGAPQFSSAFAEMINNAGMVAGNYSGGTFLFTDAAGTTDLGLPTHLLSMNVRGDVVAASHDPVTYAQIPQIRLLGKPVQNVQDYIDPGHTSIVVTGISTINDAGAFAVTGTLPGSNGQAAFMVTPTRCVGDFDDSGATEVADIFGYLNAWMGGDMRADADASGGLGVPDIFAFLNAWFAGC